MKRGGVHGRCCSQAGIAGGMCCGGCGTKVGGCAAEADLYAIRRENVQKKKHTPSVFTRMLDIF
jgi:F0F1-type ATP synthase membrane subunit c/vacuolar-type H+-ATPase subunit K